MTGRLSAMPTRSGCAWAVKKRRQTGRTPAPAGGCRQDRTALPIGDRAERRGRGLASGLQEGEIRQALLEGGRIRNVLIVSKCVGAAVEDLAYLRASWRRDFLPLRTWNDRGDRTYRDLDRLLTLIRADFGFGGCIPVYIAGDPEFARYKALARELPVAGPLPHHCGTAGLSG